MLQSEVLSCIKSKESACEYIPSKLYACPPEEYGGDVGVEEIDKFLPLVLEVEEEGTMCPIVSSGGRLPCRHSRQAHTLTLTYIYIYLRLPSYVADLCKHSRPRAVYSFWHFLFVGLDAGRTVCVANRNIIPCI